MAIVSALASTRTMSFVDLRESIGATDGNLSAHARRLEQAGYLACEKGFEGRIPKTRYRLTPAGRRALTRYVAAMRTVLDAARRN